MAKPKLAVKKEALPDYEAAAEANPSSVEAQTNLGWGLYGNGQYEKAIKQFEKAIGLNSNFIDAYYGLGLTAKKSGQTKQAREAFEKAASLVTTLDDRVRMQMLSRIIQTQLNSLRSPN